MLASAQERAVRRHVDQCSKCHAALDALTEDGELRDWMNSGMTPDESDTDPVVEHLVGNLCRWRDAQAPESPASTPELSFLGPAEAPQELGTLGCYRIQAELGRGGMGIVFRAFDDVLRREVAVKVLHPARNDDAARARFVREAQSAARVRHDHVVSVYGVANPPNAPPYLIMEYVAGMTLTAMITQQQRLEPKQAATIAGQVADGLAAAHAADLIHRDIKPSNVIIEANGGRAKIMDFGLARSDVAGDRTTQENFLAGTPSYMSPEQVQNPHRVDARTDVYSLGATLYEALTGEAPFRGTWHQILRRVLEDEPVPPRRLNEAIPRDLETICLKAMAKEPAHRYPTIRQFGDDLRRFLDGEPVRARPASWLERTWKWAKRRPAAAGLIALSAAALSMVIGGGAVVNHRLRLESARAETHLEHAVRAVDHMLAGLGDRRLADLPGFNDTRQTLLEDARALLEELHQAEPTNPAVRLAMGQVHRSIGFLYQQLDIHPNAELSCRNSIAILELLAEEHPQDPRNRFELARTYTTLGLVQRKRGQFDSALETIQQAAVLLEALSSQDVSRPEYRFDLGKTQLIRGWVYKQLGREEDGASDYRRALTTLQALIDRQPDNPAYRQECARAHHFLGWLRHDQAMNRESHSARSLYEEADTHYAAAVATREKLVEQYPDDTSYNEDLGDSYTNLANLLMQTGRDAEPIHERTIAHWRKLADTFPQRVWYRNRLGNAESNLAVLYLQQGRHLDRCGDLLTSAIRHQRAALKKNPRNPDTLRFLANHYANQAQLGMLQEKHETTARAALEWVAVRRDGDACFQAAEYLARCAGLARKDTDLCDAERQSLCQTYINHTLEMLREASKLGCPVRARSNDNPAFDSLREREDFAKLMKE
jgi:tetratricopeptide (TPR) repeat protein